MTVEILQAPVGAGKTETALERLVNTLQVQPFARVWVLVSGRRQEDAFRQRLVEFSAERRVYFNVEFLNFYGLYHRLLNIMQQPTYKLEDAGRYGLLRAILDQHAADLNVYGKIAHTPGFVRVMADFIYELKQNVVPHVKFEVAAQTPKDRDLALIYAKYQQALIDKNVVDREGEGWLALYMLRTQKTHAAVGRDVDLLLVDGFDQFTPLQAQLLMLLANRARNALLTLTIVPGREETVGRRFKQTFESLLHHSPSDAPHPLTNRRLIPPRDLVEKRVPALRHLVDHIFQPNAKRQPAGEVVTFIEAPDPAREIATVLRRVKRLLLETDCRPDDILIALRDWQRYAGHVAVFGREYSLPLALHRGEPVAQNPAVLMLLQLLRLHERDFRRRDLLDVLRSPYFRIPGIGRDQVDQLEKISRQFFVSGGRHFWLNAIGRAAVPINEKDDDETGITPAAILNSDDATALSIALDKFFAEITPRRQDTLDAYVTWLDDLIGWDIDDEVEAPTGYTLNMPDQIREESAPGVMERDLAAMSELKRVLRHLRSSQALLTTLGEGGARTREDFLLQLTTSVGGAAVNQRPSRSGRILVTTVTDARGLPHQHVFIPGLSEGLFPAPVAEDRIYLDSERVQLKHKGIELLTQAESASDDGLFYELISLAHSTLMLSRPTVQDGAPWLASHLWRESLAVFSDAEPLRLKIGAVEGDVAAYHEAFLAVADALNRPPIQPGLYNWLLSEPAHHAGWQRINTARRVELERGARLVPYDRYSGRLEQPELIAYARAQLGSDRLWSASQLNDYGVCGFRFFAKRLLRLDALEDPEDDLDAAKLGTINHEILEKSYGEFARLGLTYEPANVDQALAIMREIAEPIMRRAPYALGFRESAKWEQEKITLIRRLEALLRLDFSDQSPLLKKFAASADTPRQTIMLEAPFGSDKGTFVEIPIVVNGADEGLRVRGYIDRMDRVGDSVVVVDYKTGTTRIPTTEMLEGRNFQMMVYLLAAQQVLAGEQVLGGMFWHIRDQVPSGDILLTNTDDQQAIAQAKDHIGHYIAAGREGDFAVHANKPTTGRCTRYCEFSQFCRAASTHHGKI